MEASLAERFEALENRRVALVERVRALPPDKQDAKQGSAFSARELIAHMGISDTVSLKRIAKRPPSTLKGKATKPSFLYRKIVADLEKAKGIPAPPDMRPKGDVDLDQASKQWEDARAGMRKYLDECAKPETPILKFFILGTISASELLTLLEAHHHYHETRFPG